MIELDGHRYSQTDAARTVTIGPVLVDLLIEALDDDSRSSVGPDLDRARAAVDAVAADDSIPLDARLAATVEAWAGAAERLRASGALGPRTDGTVAHLATSGGGVPKLPVDRVEVDLSGVVGDVQASRQHHGRPWQALCLWSAEVIDSLGADGHPIGPGLAGENVTLAGLPWERVRPGALLRIGTVTCEVSAYAVPCKKNAQWFADRRFDRIHHDNGALSRAYAWVREPGTITVGDPAVLMPDA